MRKGVEQTLKAVSITDVGKCRGHNEDSVFAITSGGSAIAIVADGMGGHQAGEVASSMAIELIKKELTKKEDIEDLIGLMKKAYINANSEIYNYAKENQKVMGMGTTLVSAVVTDGKLIVANVGDSRAYEIKGRKINQITKDHSYVQSLIDSGMITKEQAMNHPKKNYITRAMGTEESIKADIFVKDYIGQTVLLCSDGLSGLVTDKEILDIVLKSENTEAAAKALVMSANEHGGTDNITVAIISR